MMKNNKPCLYCGNSERHPIELFKGEYKYTYIEGLFRFVKDFFSPCRNCYDSKYYWRRLRVTNYYKAHKRYTGLSGIFNFFNDLMTIRDVSLADCTRLNTVYRITAIAFGPKGEDRIRIAGEFERTLVVARITGLPDIEPHLSREHGPSGHYRGNFGLEPLPE